MREKASATYLKGKDACSAEFDRMSKILPKLEINDTVEYQGNMYIVRHIAYNYLSKAQMTLHVKNYEAPPLEMQKMDIEPKGLAFLEPEPEPEENLFENPEMLKELHPVAKEYALYLARETKKEMENTGLEFVKIYITSVRRTVAEQVIILSKKMRRVNTTHNMFEYYESQIKETGADGNREVGKSPTLNYLDAIQAHYDGIRLPDTERWIKIPDSEERSYRSEIEAMGKLPLGGEDGKECPRTVRAEALLNKYMARGHFTPSHHMKPIGECYVVDIRIIDNKEQTADKLFAENKKYYPDCKNTPPDEKCEAGYKSKSDGEPHIHLKLLKNYKS